MVSLAPQQLTEAALELAKVAGVVATVCDHAEHNEPADITALRESGLRLRKLGATTAQRAGHDPVVLYAERLGSIERRNVLHQEGAFDGAAAARQAATWRELQLVQIAHDRWYHPDVIGLAKVEQLRHYALHVAKLAGTAADTAAGVLDEDDFIARRVADALLFGIKLATVTGERLAEEPVLAGAELPGAPKLQSVAV